MAERYSAVLTWFNGDKGYGFLIDLDGHQQFVRYVAAPTEGFRILTEGARFEFSITPTPKGLMAYDITTSRTAGIE